jgi:hypothetical protein
MEKNKTITEKNLQDISAWLKTLNLSDFQNNVSKKDTTVKFIEDMVVVKHTQIKEPYTL